MQSSQSSSLNSETPVPHKESLPSESKWVSLVTWLVRLVTGAVFTFSGFVKGIDPWGTVYKFDEYLAALGIPMSHGLVTVAVFALCVIEFMIGINMLFGCYRRSNSVMAMLFMVVMLPLTLWIAVSDPVADCGCFGDALILSNWATFWKNIALTICIIWLLKFNKRVPCIITPAFQWISYIVTALYMLCICIYGYNVQPMLDFRPFKVGTEISDANSLSEGPEYTFIYSKDGIEKEFSEEDLPNEEDGWTFVSRNELPHPEEKGVSDHSFSVMDKSGGEDATEEAIDTDGGEFLLLIPSLEEISASTTYKINLLYDWAEAHDIRLVAVVAANTGDINEWEDLSMPRYDIYTADDTSIKELARGNPAIVYLENGNIIWKTTLGALNEEYFSTPETPTDVKSMVTDGRNSLKNFTLIYLAIMAFLVCISMIPRLSNLFRPLGYKGPENIMEYREYRANKVADTASNRDGMAHRGESSSPDKSVPQRTDEPSHD